MHLLPVKLDKNARNSKYRARENACQVANNSLIMAVSQEKYLPCYIIINGFMRPDFGWVNFYHCSVPG